MQNGRDAISPAEPKPGEGWLRLRARAQRVCALAFALAAALLPVAPARGGPFPKPDPEHAFAELKVYDAAGHPWRAAVEDWAGARRRVADDPRWAAWLAGERTQVDAWMAKWHDRVSWVCGWWHDFVSPKDGSHLIWTPQVPGEDVAFLHSASDPHVPVNPKLLAAWVFEFRGRHAAMMERAARLYRLTGDERYAAWAAAQLDFYADHYREWPAQRDGARIFWQTLDVAVNGITYADTVRLLGDDATPARREQWRRQLFEPMADVLNHSFQQIHNIATWQRCAVAVFALVFDDEALWRGAIDGRYGLRAQLAEGVTSDYLWWEQSLGYNGYVVQAVLTLFTDAGLYGRAAELGPGMATAENLMLAPLYLRFPNGLLPNPADSTGLHYEPDRALFAAAYRVFPTTLGLAEIAGRRDWSTLLDPPPPSPRPAELPPVTSRNLESTRMAVLKSGPWQVFFHYGQLTRSHSQAEALNFSAFYGDTDVTHDPGTVGYGSPLHRDYYTRGLNHNVPLLNGEGEEPPQPGRLLAFSPDSVSAEQPRYRTDAIARRTLAIAGDRLIDTAEITASQPRPQRLGLALHLQGRVRLPEVFQSDPDFARGRPAAFGYWRDARRAEFRDRADFAVDFGAVTLRVTIATPGPFTVWHASTPDTPPDRREGFYVETQGTAATFTTTFEPAPHS
jgi:hypothetical protein